MKREAKWFFRYDDADGCVHLQARFEGEDGTIGDAYQVIAPNHPRFEELKAAGAGTIQANVLTGWETEK